MVPAEPMLESSYASEKVRAAERALVWHVITCEYPPQSGGVSDYTFLLAKSMASCGDEVHVWCPALPAKAPESRGVIVHPELGTFSPRDLRNAGKKLDRFEGPRPLLVQWVPHGFGYKSVNVPFCLWLWRRAAHQGDSVDLMVHEPFSPFCTGNWRQNAAAAVHRLMTLILLRTADRVLVSTPSWNKMLGPYQWVRKHNFTWLPVPSNVPVTGDLAAASIVRNQYGSGGPLIGHFGTFGSTITPLLQDIVPSLLRKASNASLLLIGQGSGNFRERLASECADLVGQISATGSVDDPERLSSYLSACDLMVQPYPDGVTTRRGTIMATLSHGRASITTSGVLTEPLWQSSGAVVLVPAGDAAAFVDSALQIIHNSQQRASLGRTAQEFYMREFDLRHNVERLRNTASSVHEARNSRKSRYSERLS